MVAFADTSIRPSVCTPENAYPRFHDAILSTKYFDDETELAYYGFRYYSPELGRFISRDPIGENGGQNLCSVVQNNPIGNVDPSGLEWTCSAETDFLTSYTIQQTTPSYEVGILLPVPDFHQFTETRLICVSPGGCSYVEVPTHYTCKCRCAKSLRHRKRTVTCKKYRDTTTCGDECSQDNPLVYTEDYWVPEYGEPTTVIERDTYGAYPIDLSGEGAMTALGCIYRCSLACSAGSDSPPVFSDDVVCSDAGGSQ